jgi:predicted HTH transcriptional regulator
MDTSFVIDQIRLLISQNEMDAAIHLLNNLLLDSPKLDDAIMQSARHQDIMRQIRLGLIGEQQAEQSKNQIRNSLLSLLRDVESHLEKPAEIARDYHKITQKIATNRGIGTSELLKGKTATDLDKRELERFFQRVRTQRRFADDHVDWANLSVHERLLSLSLAENGHLYKGTFLCLGQSNQIESIAHSAAESKFAIFKGTTRNHFLVLETVRGNLIQQYEKMLLLLQQHIPLKRDVLKSQDEYEIPFIAFKELTTNAFIHRSYQADVNSSIQIELFDDRLEIKSPGLFPQNVDLEHIEISNIVNPSIAAIFFLYGHI